MRVSLILVKSNNSFTGNSSDEIFVSGSGDDILQGKGGMDVFHAGAAPLITNPPMPEEISLRLTMALLVLPNTT
jgi:hypothetical protein